MYRTSWPAAIAGLLACASIAQAQTPSNIIDAGPGWQRIAEPLSAEAAAKARASLSAQSGDPTVRDLVVISTPQGVEGAPISPALKDLLRDEFASSSGVSAASAQPEDPVIIDLKLAEAVAAGTALDQFGDYVEPDESAGAGAQFLGCSTHWRTSDVRVFDRAIEQTGYDKEFPGEDEDMDAKLGGHLNFTGQATAKIVYQWKKTSFCIPWIARFKHARVSGFVSMDNSSLDLSLGFSAKKIRKELFKLLDVQKSFMVGPVPVVVGAQIPFGWGVATSVNFEGGFSAGFPMRGTRRFDYICTFKDRCQNQLDANDPNNDNTLEFTAVQDVEFGYGGAGSITVKPYIYLEALGYLYDPRVSHVGFGFEAGLPVTVFFNHGNCGAGTEILHGAFADLNAELSFYFKYNAAGLADTLGIDWDKEVRFLNLWTVFKTEDVIRGNKPIHVLRRNLWFTRFNEPDSAVSPFTPIVVTDGIAGVGFDEPISARMRDCIPLKDPVTYQIEWEDKTTTTMREYGDNNTGHRNTLAQTTKKWTSAGKKAIRIYPLTDTAGRDLTKVDLKKSVAATARTVDVSQYVAPPAPTAVTLAKEGTTGLKLTWKAPTNTTKYKIELEKNGVWSYIGIVYAPNVSHSLANNANGTYRYRIAACNDNGGVERCQNPAVVSNTAIIGNPPPPPSSVSNVDRRCFGMAEIRWSAVNGATSYKLYSNTLNDASKSVQVYSGTALKREVNPPAETYYWVKACNVSGCSTFSTSTRTRMYPGCA
jgi:hypothetical protein